VLGRRRAARHVHRLTAADNDGHHLLATEVGRDLPRDSRNTPATPSASASSRNMGEGSTAYPTLHSPERGLLPRNDESTTVTLLALKAFQPPKRR
jgi:hypothetical protein